MTLAYSDQIIQDGDRRVATGLPDGRFIPAVSLSGPVIDPFGRIVTAAPYTLADLEFIYDSLPRFYDSILATGGTATHLPLESAVRLRTTTTDGSSAVLQTRRYYRYQAGKSGSIVMTSVIGAGVTNVRKRIGYFDGNNGLFFEQIGSEFAVVIRTDTSGSPVDGRETFSSSELSNILGFDLDFSTLNIFAIDFQWLGAGLIIFSIFRPDGVKTPIYTFENANQNTGVYMRTASLPVRYEIMNLATQATTTDLKANCASVVSSGGATPFGYEFHRSSDIVTTTSADPHHLISYRLASTFNSLTNRSIVLPEEFNFEFIDDSAHFSIFYHRSAVNGGSWVSVGPSSGVEYNITPTSVTTTGGDEIHHSVHLGGTNPSRAQPHRYDSGFRGLAMTLSADGTTSDFISIFAERVTGNIEAAAGMSWKEVR